MVPLLPPPPPAIVAQLQTDPEVVSAPEVLEQPPLVVDEAPEAGVDVRGRDLGEVGAVVVAGGRGVVEGEGEGGEAVAAVADLNSRVI